MTQKVRRSIILLIIFGLLISSNRSLSVVTPRIGNGQESPPPLHLSTGTQGDAEEKIAEPMVDKVQLPEEAPAQTAPSEPPFPELYDCEVDLVLMDGPLAGNRTRFTVLGQDYFADKGDKFFPGRNTAVYYELVRYLILHSAYLDGNLLKPLEAEFLRFYLEFWGDPEPREVQSRIESLVGSKVSWACNGQVLFNTEITGIIRLSQDASHRLWLHPLDMRVIVQQRDGLADEWVGDLPTPSKPGIYVGFCGWGPPEQGDARFYAYRYLIQFEVFP